MSFGQAVSTCFSEYVTFSGRARRSEFWYWILFTVLVGIVAGTLDTLLFPNTTLGTGDTGNGPVTTVTNLALALPSLAVTARRLHDIDKSGWWQLLNLIPIVGWIIMIVWTVRDGQRHPNRFGNDPKGQLGGPAGYGDGYGGGYGDGYGQPYGGPQDQVPPRSY